MKMKTFFGCLLCLPLIIWFTVRVVKDVVFDINCSDRLKRAADANTVELATQEMEAVVSFLEANQLTAGYTSILYRTPDEDVGFWYTNLNSALSELKNVKPEATQLEKTNVLMKLRETILDSGESGVKITVPSGMSIFPHNVIYLLMAIITSVVAIVGACLIAVGLNEY